MVILLSIVGSVELHQMLVKKGYRVKLFLPIILNLILLVTTFFLADATNNQTNNWSQTHYRVLAYQNMILGFSFLVIIAYHLFLKPRAQIAELGSSFLQIIYMGYFPCYLIFIRFIDQGPGILAWSLTAVAMSDIFGFFVGKYLGKRPFFQHLSPNKTLEGSLGGVCGTVLFAIIGGYFLNLPWWHCIVLGVAFAYLGQIGDLLESMIKRDAEVKDSGDIIPGHGGILDRVDSYILVGVLTYFYLINFVLPNAY